MDRQHPMFRRRTGTGGLYADNSGRLMASSVQRQPRRSRLPRVSTADRLWTKDGADKPVVVDLQAMVARFSKQAEKMLDMLADVGGEVTFCLRRRERLPPDVVRELNDVLGWYFVFFTVGLIDRRGTWIGDAWHAPRQPSTV